LAGRRGPVAGGHRMARALAEPARDRLVVRERRRLHAVQCRRLGPDPGVRPGRDRCTVQPLRRHGGLRRRSVAGRQQLSRPGRPGDGGADPADRDDREAPLRCGTDAEATRMTVRCDVVVIGAGIAGLTAASVLADRGRTVTVLEARDRVGGRLHSVPVEGGVVEAGATWFWDNEPLVLSLADQLGLSTYPQHLAGGALWAGPAVQRLRSEERRGGRLWMARSVQEQ